MLKPNSLTREQILALTGRRLDLLVLRAAGWAIHPGGEGIPQASQNWFIAGPLLEEALGWERGSERQQQFLFALHDQAGVDSLVGALAVLRDVLPLAICRAYLVAKGVADD